MGGEEAAEAGEAHAQAVGDGADAEGQQLGQIRSDFSPEELVDAVAAVAMRRMFHLVSNPDLKARPLREAERLQGLLAPMLGLSI